MIASPARAFSEIRTSVLTKLRYAKAVYDLPRFNRDWDAAISRLRVRTVQRPVRKILVLPCDPRTLTGSLGDDAMISACAQFAAELNPEVVVHAVTGGDSAKREALRRGLVPVDIWASRNFLSEMVDLLNGEAFDAVAALGADVLDGYYNFMSPTRLIAACDLASRAGVPTAILGFSFNERPNPYVIPALKRLDPSVRLNVRDPISYARFQRSVGVPATLVADSAFSMDAGSAPAGAVEWIEGRRAAGDVVIGFNIHPMIIKNASHADVHRLIERSVAAISEVGRDRKLSWFFLPHDYRGDFGDGRCLAPIAEQVAPRLPGRTFYLSGEHKANALKGVANALDGVICARMHLAIAALGSGVPTFCVTYQDKFEGLFRHFELDDALFVSPADFLKPTALEDRLSGFVDGLEGLRQSIGARLPAIKALSRRNFTALEEAP